jgi:hypothetical protein
MAAGPRYITSARTAQKTPLPTALLLGDVAMRADRTKRRFSVACTIVVALMSCLLCRNLVTAFSSYIISHYASITSAIGPLKCFTLQVHMFDIYVFFIEFCVVSLS